MSCARETVRGVMSGLLCCPAAVRHCTLQHSVTQHPFLSIAMLLQRRAACHSPAPALNSIFLFGRQSHLGGSPMPAQLGQSLLVIATPAKHGNEVALQQHIPSQSFNTTGHTEVGVFAV